MSSTDFSSRYDFQFSTTAADGTNNMIAFEFLSRGEMTDAMAFDLAAAFKALPWPSTSTVTADVTKQDVTDVAYTTNPTATPPSFT